MAGIGRVHFVELNAKVNTLSMVDVFPKYGTPLLATLLKQQGYDVQIFLEGVSDMSPHRIAACDLVCLPVFAPAYNKVKALAARLRARAPGLSLVTGGPQAILHPETLVGLCDFVVCCEGDEALPELIGCLERGGDPALVRGLAFEREGELVRTPPREPPAIPEVIPDITLIDGIDGVLARYDRYRTIQNTLQTSRGCTYRCRFCPTARLFGDSYRTRDIDRVVDEIRHKQRYNDTFFVLDNNFFGDMEYSTALLERLAAEDLGASFIVFARQEVGQDAGLLALMKRAGVACVIVGVESLSDHTLAAFRKRQRSRDVVRSIENIKRAGIHVVATFAFGYDDDTRARADQIVSFIRTHQLGLNIFILLDTHTEGGEALIPPERRFETYYARAPRDDSAHHDYVTGSFVTFFPRRIKPSSLQRCYLEIYDRVYTNGYIMRSALERSAFEAVFSVFHGLGVRRLNRVVRRVVDEQYMEHLLRMEDGLYDDRERLKEDRLAELDHLPPPPFIDEQVDRTSYNRLTDLAVLPGAARYYLDKARWRLRRSSS